MTSKAKNEITLNEIFITENGDSFEQLRITYTTSGAISKNRDNIIWIFHPLTCDSDPENWWNDIVGFHKVINPIDYFIVCVDVIGSCNGSTSPQDINPTTGKIWGKEFPLLTFKDVIKTFQIVKSKLSIDKIFLGIGSSFGGQQLYEWIAEEPSLFEYACIVGASPKQSPWAIAFNESQRMALESDDSFNNNKPAGGKKGLAAARSIAVLTYRTSKVYEKTQSELSSRNYNNFRAASYQQYIGKKFTNRFCAFSYYALTKLMDTHNIARGRESIFAALKPIKTKIRILNLADDVLFKADENEIVTEVLSTSLSLNLDTNYGHDSILANASLIAHEIEKIINQSKQKNMRYTDSDISVI